MSKKKRKKRKKKKKAKVFGSLNITDALEFTCPFCQAHCTASLEHYAVMHAVPMCEKFEQLSPDEFLKAVNERMAN